jgi:DNA replication initiation complex subunit (GINS family)
MSHIVNAPVLEEEFKTLFLYNLLDRLKIYSSVAPIRNHYNGEDYDNNESVKHKLSSIFTITQNTAMPPQEFKINLKIGEQVLYSLSDLEKMVSDLNRKISNYKLAMIAGESMDATVDRFLLRIQEFMLKRGLPEFTSEAVGAIAELVKIAQLSDKEKEYFYKSLANGKLTKQKFYDILGNTCDEFKASLDKSRQQQNIKAKCSCPSEISDESVRYSRKSLAIMKAQEDMATFQNRTPLTLTLGKCSNASNAWHYWLQIV